MYMIINEGRICSPSEQFWPLKPVVQLHVYDVIPLIHVPLFRQGYGSQWSGAMKKVFSCIFYSFKPICLNKFFIAIKLRRDVPLVVVVCMFVVCLVVVISNVVFSVLTVFIAVKLG